MMQHWKRRKMNEESVSSGERKMDRGMQLPFIPSYASSILFSFISSLPLITIKRKRRKKFQQLQHNRQINFTTESFLFSLTTFVIKREEKGEMCQNWNPFCLRWGGGRDPKIKSQRNKEKERQKAFHCLQSFYFISFSFSLSPFFSSTPSTMTTTLNNTTNHFSFLSFFEVVIPFHFYYFFFSSHLLLPFLPSHSPLPLSPSHSLNRVLFIRVGRRANRFFSSPSILLLNPSVLFVDMHMQACELFSFGKNFEFLLLLLSWSVFKFDAILPPAWRFRPCTFVDFLEICSPSLCQFDCLSLFSFPSIQLLDGWWEREREDGKGGRDEKGEGCTNHNTYNTRAHKTMAKNFWKDETGEEK